jgi:hypothetical protein
MLMIKEDSYSEKWVEFEEGEKYLIRYLSAHKLKEIEEQTKDKFEQDLYMYDHIIKDWDGIVDKDSKPLECSVQNKVALISRFSDRRIFLLRKALAVDTFTGAKPEVVKKN